MLPDAKTYDDLIERFAWEIPEFYNIGVDVCDRWAAAEPERVALIFVEKDGQSREMSYGELRAQSNRLANMLVAKGLQPGDRVGLLLPQAPETIFAHIAVYKTGAIAVPLFTLFGPEALEFRLGNSGARFVITNAEGARKLSAIRAGLADLMHVFVTDGVQPDTQDLRAELEAYP